MHMHVYHVEIKKLIVNYISFMALKFRSRDFGFGFEGRGFGFEGRGFGFEGRSFGFGFATSWF